MARKKYSRSRSIQRTLNSYGKSVENTFKRWFANVWIYLYNELSAKDDVLARQIVKKITPALKELYQQKDTAYLYEIITVITTQFKQDVVSITTFKFLLKRDMDPSSTISREELREILPLLGYAILEEIRQNY